MVRRDMNLITRAKTVSLLRGAIAVALCALAMVLRVESQENSKHTVLAIAYFGSLDHPIFPIVISDSYGEAERYRNAMMEKETLDFWNEGYLHVLSPALLDRLIATVGSDKGGVQQEPEPQHPYNGVSMTVVTPQGRKTFFFHVETAMSLLDRLGMLCKDQKSVRSHLSDFKNWISLWSDDPPPRPVPQEKR